MKPFILLIFCLEILLVSSCQTNPPQTDSQVISEKQEDELIENQSLLPPEAQNLSDSSMNEDQETINNQDQKNEQDEINDEAAKKKALLDRINAMSPEEKIDWYYTQLTQDKISISREEFSSLVEFINQYLESNPNHIRGNIIQTYIYLFLKDRDHVVAHANKLAQLSSNDLEELIQLGTASAMAGFFSDAIKRFDQIIQANPNYANAYFNKGRALFLQKKFDEAIESYQETISVQPDYYQAYNNIGWTYLAKNEPEKSIDYFKKALSIKPDYYSAQYNLCLALIQNKQWDESLAEINAYLTSNPNDSNAYRNLAYIYQQKNDLVKGAQALEKAIEINPYDLVSRNNLAVLLISNGRFKEAINHFKFILDKKPSDETFVTEVSRSLAIACHRYGIILSEANKNDEAIKSFEDYLLYYPELTDDIRSDINKRITQLKQ